MVYVHVKLPWKNDLRSTTMMRVSRVPCISEHLEIIENGKSRIWFVKRVVHYVNARTEDVPPIVALVEVSE